MPNRRETWMDLVKGLSMLVVVFGHTASFTWPWGEEHPAIQVQNAATAALRMPVVAALAGALVPRSLRNGVTSFVAGKLRGLVWPYLLWATLTAIAVRGFSGVGNIVQAVAFPAPYLWFSWSLVIGFALAVVLKDRERLIVPAAVGCVLVSAFVPDVLGEVTFNAAFVLFGWWFAERRGRLSDRASTWTIVMGFTAAAVTAGFSLPGVTEAVFGYPDRYLTRHSWAWVWGPLGLTVAVFLVGSRWRSHRALRPLNWVGKHSMVFYSAHPFVAVVLAEVFRRVLPHELLAEHTTLCTFALYAVVLATLVALVNLRRFRLVDLAFAWPAPRAKAKGIADRAAATRRT